MAVRPKEPYFRVTRPCTAGGGPGLQHEARRSGLQVARRSTGKKPIGQETGRPHPGQFILWEPQGDPRAGNVVCLPAQPLKLVQRKGHSDFTP